jgi:hypothetical protein
VVAESLPPFHFKLDRQELRHKSIHGAKFSLTYDRFPIQYFKVSSEISFDLLCTWVLHTIHLRLIHNLQY